MLLHQQLFSWWKITTRIGRQGNIPGDQFMSKSYLALHPWRKVLKRRHDLLKAFYNVSANCHAATIIKLSYINGWFLMDLG